MKPASLGLTRRIRRRKIPEAAPTPTHRDVTLALDCLRGFSKDGIMVDLKTTSVGKWSMKVRNKYTKEIIYKNRSVSAEALILAAKRTLKGEDIESGS